MQNKMASNHAARSHKAKRRDKISFAHILIICILLLIAASIVQPMMNLLARALSDPTQAFRIKGLDILPQGFSFFHFEVILSNDLVWISLKNPLFITIVGTALSVLLTCSAAYSLTRPELFGKRVFMYFLIIMMIVVPGMVQEYFLMKNLGLLDKIWSMVFFKSVSVYYLIILMRFFEEVPQSFVEAAKLDGAGHLTIFFKIFMPLRKVPVITISMFYFVARWNEFFYSSIFLSSRGNTTLQVLLRKFVVENDQSNIIGIQNIAANNIIAQLDMNAMKSATIWVTLIPILLIYPIVLKYHVGGVLSGGVKE